MQNLVINEKTYENVQKVQFPLSDGSGNADFIDTTGATATAENIDKGFNAFVNGELVVGTKESVSGSSPFSFTKIGEYGWSNMPDESITTQFLILNCKTDIVNYITEKITELGLSGHQSYRFGFFIKSKEKPTATGNIKGIIVAISYVPSNGSIQAMTPMIGITGAYYGGIDCFNLTAKSSSGTVQEDENLHIQFEPSKLESQTLEIYAFDINF